MPEVWANWAGQQRCAPAAIERPAGEDELAAVIRGAAERGLAVRAVGTGHSFTDIACTDGVMVSLERMNHVLDADSGTGLVRVQAGISINTLGAELERRGLALENQGDIDRQAIAGALATATHGTGARFANLSARVVAMRVVTGTGEVVELGEADGDGLRAARVGLGALGVVTEVTLRCVPLFTLRRVDGPAPLDETLETLDELVDGHDHFEFYAFPYSELALTRRTERLDAPPERAGPLREWFQETLLENVAIGFAARAGRAIPSLIPRINRVLASAVGRSVKVDRSWRVYASRRHVRFTEMEYAIPRAHAREAVERVLDLVRRRALPVGFPIEVRFAAQDDAFLSTAEGRDTCYVAVHQFVGMEYEAYFRGVERIMDEYEGRPHWGKRHYQSAATLAPRYPEWDRFQAVRARLDPGGAFVNDYVARVLGPVSAASPA